MVPAGQNRRRHRLSGADGHVRCHTLRSTRLEYPGSYQGYLRVPGTHIQVKYINATAPLLTLV